MSAWNRDDIIRMAREAGFEVIADHKDGNLDWVCFTEELERFAALVATHKTEVAIAEAYRCGHEAGVVEEREACAMVCEDNADDLSEGDWDSACINCADHIRARSNP